MPSYTQTITGSSSSTKLEIKWNYTVTSTNSTTTIEWTSVKFTATGSDWFIPFVRLIDAGTVRWSRSPSIDEIVKQGKTLSATIGYAVSVPRSTAQQSRSVGYGRKIGSAGTWNDTSTTIIIPALPTYRATYYANGGSGTTQTQDYQYSKSMTTKTAAQVGFSRTNFTLSKWNTQGTGKGTNYNLGTAYTPNASLSLYAIWTRIYTSPILYISQAYRCTSDGTQDDFGTCARVIGTFNIWKTSATNTVSSLTASVNGHSASQSSFTYSDSGDWRTGTFDVIIADATLDEETPYTLSVTLTDAKGGASGYSTGTVTRSADIPTAFYTMDILAGGRGVTFGGVASTQDLFEVDWDMLLNGDLQIGSVNPIRIHEAENQMTTMGFESGGGETEFLRLWGSDDWQGNGIGLGAGGLTILGSGESVVAMKTISEKVGWSSAAEHMLIGTDNSEIYFFPNLQSYSESETVTRYRFALTSGPNIRIDQTADGGATWSTVTYLQKETRVQPVANGGTGNTGVVSNSTSSSIISAASGINITAASVQTWGKVAMIAVSYTVNKDVSVPASGNITDVDIGTVKDAYKPYTYARLVSDNYGARFVLKTDGTLTMQSADARGGAYTASSGFSDTARGTYILHN